MASVTVPVVVLPPVTLVGETVSVETPVAVAGQVTTRDKRTASASAMRFMVHHRIASAGNALGSPTGCQSGSAPRTHGGGVEAKGT